MRAIISPGVLRFQAVVAMLVALATSATATVVPSPGSESIDNLFASSSSVIRGEIKQVSVEGVSRGVRGGVSTELTWYLAQIAVETTYKGVSSSTQTIRYVRPNSRMCSVSICIDLRPGEFDYFFLTGGGPPYVLHDPFFGKFRASRLRSSGGTSGINALKDDFVAGLQEDEKPTRLIQIELVGSSARREDRQKLKALLPSADDGTRSSVYYALLRLRDYSVLGQMRLFFEETTLDPELQRLRFLSLSLVNAIDGSELDDLEREAVRKELVKLAHSSSDDLRESTIHALRTLGSAKSVPVFVHSLDDRVWSVRYDAVLALASIEKKWEFAPAVDTFRANEGKYISAWKSWWDSSGKYLYDPN